MGSKFETAVKHDGGIRLLLNCPSYSVSTHSYAKVYVSVNLDLIHGSRDRDELRKQGQRANMLRSKREFLDREFKDDFLLDEVGVGL